MPRIEFNPTITFGNIVTLAVLGVGLAAAWGEKNADFESLSKSDHEHDAAISAADNSIRSLEKSQERILERLDSIKASVERLEKKIP